MVIESDLAANEITTSDSFTMGSKLRVNGEPVTAVRAFAFSESRSPIPKTSISSSSLRLGFNSLESIVNFRGHQFITPFNFRVRQAEQPKTVIYETTHRKLNPGPSNIQVINSDEYRADVVFIIDCSKSMEVNQVKGKIQEGGGEAVKATRFVFATEALKTAIRELAKENRFRIGLYAFGHRVGFEEDEEGRPIIDEKTKRYRITPPSSKFHPFNDCEAMFRLSDHKEEIANSGDIAKILGKISVDNLHPRGITPLYFSIKMAAEKEFNGPQERPRYIVAITDGDNLQIENRDTAQGASLPENKSVDDETTADTVKQELKKRGITLLVARILKKGGRVDNIELEGAAQRFCLSWKTIRQISLKPS